MASPNDTRITPAPTFTDGLGVVWSISFFFAQRNGYNTTAHASEGLWHDGIVYIKGRNGHWWRLNEPAGNVWTDVGATDPAATPSPDDVRITPAGMLEDSLDVTWTISHLFAQRDGYNTTAHATEALWHDNQVYLLGRNGHWWKQLTAEGNVWIDVGPEDPTSGNTEDLIPYPNNYPVPTYQEYAFGDIKDRGTYPANDCPTYKYTDQVMREFYEEVKGRPPPEPGRYMAAHNAPIIWNNIGGDWADKDNVAQGKVPFASVAVAAGFSGWKTFDLMNLVQAWLDGTYRNAGLWLRGSTSTATYWHSRFWSTVAERPYIRLTSSSLGDVDVPCARSIRVNGSTEGAIPEDPILQCAGTFEGALLWFDLERYAAADITAATLNIHGGGSTAQTIGVFRCVNPADQQGDVGVAPIGEPRIGLAAKYPLDVGIEDDPAVYWIQRFKPTTWQKIWIGKTGGIVTNTPDETDGFYPLPSGDYAWRFKFAKAGTPGADGEGFNLNFSTWRGTPIPESGLRLKPLLEVEELYMRHYLFLAEDKGSGRPWHPLPLAGKHFGFNMRFAAMGATSDGAPQLPGMGQGNSGSGCSGANGSSARMNYDRSYTPGNPAENLYGFGTGDMYHADMEGMYGHDVPWSKNYLGLHRQGEWASLEMRLKMNSVTDDTQKPRRIMSLRQTGGIATATLEKDETDPAYAIGQIWNVQGLYGSRATLNSQYAGDKTITAIIDAKTFQYAVPTNTPGTAVTNFWIVCAPCRGNFDGIIQCWRNGIPAHWSDKWRFRHFKWRTDGGLYGIDAAWMAGFNGGDPALTQGIFTYYTSQIIVATEYIGPQMIPKSQRDGGIP